MTFPPLDFVRPPWANNLALPVAGSRSAPRYLGNYPSLFESQQAQDAAVPTWDAMLWIADHYQNVAVEETPWDMLYELQVEPNWTQDAPAAVKATGVFCELVPRRLLWALDATIDSRQYNWPVIDGRFDTFSRCATAYMLFFETHKIHQDPVCFRAAVFSRFLAQICMLHHICINVN